MQEEINILIAEDDPQIQLLLSATLQDMDGVKLHLASDGEEAVQMGKAHSPVIALLDVQMPKLDGIEVCRRLKSNPSTAETRVVMLTAFTMETTRENARAAGADLFLAKPFSPREVLQVLWEAQADPVE